MGAADSGLTGSRISVVLYKAAAPFTGQTSTDYDLRDTTTRNVTIPLARGGIVDLGFALNHTLTKVLGTGLAVNAGTDRITSTAHGLYNGQIVRLANLSGVVGVSAATSYYVANAAANDFQLANVSGQVQDITTGGTADVSVSCDLHVEVYTVFGGVASANSVGVQAFATAPASTDMIYDGRYTLLPEVGDNQAATVGNKSFAIPELRQPLDGVRLSYGARLIPDAGTMTFQVTGRS